MQVRTLSSPISRGAGRTSPMGFPRGRRGALAEPGVAEARAAGPPFDPVTFPSKLQLLPFASLVARQFQAPMPKICVRSEYAGSGLSRRSRRSSFRCDASRCEGDFACYSLVRAWLRISIAACIMSLMNRSTRFSDRRPLSPFDAATRIPFGRAILADVIVTAHPVAESSVDRRASSACC